MKHSAALIFPNQLFEKHPALEQTTTIFMLEHPRFFTEFNFHKQKLILHRASMKYYEHMMAQRGYRVFYIEYDQNESFVALLKKHQITHLHTATIDDTPLEMKLKKFCQQQNIALFIHESPGFLTTRSELSNLLGQKDHYLMNSFYIAQRKRLDILVHAGKPKGGKWNYDFMNRMKFPQNLQAPEIAHPKRTSHVLKAINYVENNFNNNPGTTELFLWPTTHSQAHAALEDFLEHRLKQFGPYQDAIDSQKPFLFHSLLSSSINSGLLTPEQVLNKTLDFAGHHKIPLSSLEGFIRQIIGWREFIRGIYLLKGEEQRSSNFFKHTRPLPTSFWSATTTIEPLDQTIKKIIKTGYAHHIERLMILGNFMLITETNPYDCYKWFMEFFIDAYDWVMVPNVFGMSQYADGGIMTTKPYFSGSHYIKKMSNYPKGSWCDVWDALYWNFVYKQKNSIGKNARLNFITMYLKKINPSVLKNHLKAAHDFLEIW